MPTFRYDNGDVKHSGANLGSFGKDLSDFAETCTAYVRYVIAHNDERHVVDWRPNRPPRLLRRQLPYPPNADCRRTSCSADLGTFRPIPARPRLRFLLHRSRRLPFYRRATLPRNEC